MTIYREADGTAYQVAPGQHAEVVAMLRSGMLRDPGNNSNYMANVAGTVMDLFGLSIPMDNEKAFLQALVDLEILKKECE